MKYSDEHILKTKSFNSFIMDDDVLYNRKQTVV